MRLGWSVQAKGGQGCMVLHAVHGAPHRHEVPLLLVPLEPRRLDQQLVRHKQPVDALALWLRVLHAHLHVW